GRTGGDSESDCKRAPAGPEGGRRPVAGWNPAGAASACGGWTCGGAALPGPWKGIVRAAASEASRAETARRGPGCRERWTAGLRDRKSTRLNSSHVKISYAVFCLKKKRRQRPQARAASPLENRQRGAEYN